jgi:syntaxin-binding protein 1
MPDQLVRMLDDSVITPPDRLRLIALYALWKQGMLSPDINKLLLHSQLPPQDQTIINNLELLGAQITKQLGEKDYRPRTPLFQRKQAPPTNDQDEVLISRFEPGLKTVLEDHIRGNLDAALFPYVRPDQAPLPSELMANQSSASLRSTKPTWAYAASSTSVARPRERIIVFAAGGATYSEGRVCYEVGEKHNRDVVLMTTHMLTPRVFLGQLADLAVDRKRLNLPQDRQAKRAPNHLFEDDKPPPAPRVQQVQAPPQPQRPPQQQQQQTQRVTEGFSRINLNGGGSGDRYGDSSKLKKDDKKKKHGFFR